MLKQQKGFSLVELIVIVVILGILAAISIPYMKGFLFSATYRDAAQDVLQILRQARGRAVATNREHRTEFDLTNHRFRLVEVDPSVAEALWARSDWMTMPNDVMLKSKIGCTGTDDFIFRFRSNGTADIAEDGIICIMNAAAPAEPRKFEVSVTQNTGRATVEH